MKLERRMRAVRANETQQLTRPIEAALNRLPGVHVTRNNNLGPVVPYARRHQPDIRPIIAGLGEGSADLVGVVTMYLHGIVLGGRAGVRAVPQCDPTVAMTVGRVLALEVKRPGVKPGPDQVRWLAQVRKLGGFAAVVHSIDEAVAAVARCRAGASE